MSEKWTGKTLKLRVSLASLGLVCVLGLGGCGSSSQPTAGPQNSAAATAKPGTTKPAQQDIRQQVGPFFNEKYMKVEDRFQVRRERLLKLLQAN